jgi:hypothetical protein
MQMASIDKCTWHWAARSQRHPPPLTVCYDESVWQRKAIRHGGSFLKHVIPAIVKPLHSLWNEVIGFFFLCFGAMFGVWTFRYYRMYTQAPPAAAPEFFGKVIVTALVGLMMLGFGISSFRRANKISRS